MTEAILILVRIKLPVIERALFGGDRKRAKFCARVAVAHRALAEITFDKRVA